MVQALEIAVKRLADAVDSLREQVRNTQNDA
jgi:hypothetical protein